MSYFKTKRLDNASAAVPPKMLARMPSKKSNASLWTEEDGDAIDPNGWGIKIWYHVILTSLCVESYLIPFFVAFKPNALQTMPHEGVVVLVSEAIMLLDFLVQAHTGYYDDGNIVRDKKKSRQRYFRSSMFALDLFTFIPFSIFPFAPQGREVTCELHKLLRCVKAPKVIATLDDMYAKQFVIVKFLKVLVTTGFLAHSVACLRFSFGYDVNGDNPWLPPLAAQPPTVQHEYLVSLFWAFGMLTGLFEGQLPRTIPQFLFNIFVALCGFSLFTSLCATFFMISKCRSGSMEPAEARINQLQHLLSFHHVPERLQTQAIDYLRRYYTDVESSDREVMRLLCPSIVQDIQVELMKTTVAKIPLFTGCRDEFIAAIASLLELVSIPAHCVVFREGEYGDSMYIVHSGVFNVVVKQVAVREMRKGTCFGELAVFSNTDRTATVLSATYSTLYKLSRFHGERVLEGYPECQALVSASVQRLLRDTDMSDKLNMLSTISSGSSSSFKFPSWQVERDKVRNKLASTFDLFGAKKPSYVVPGVEDLEDDSTPCGQPSSVKHGGQLKLVTRDLGRSYAANKAGSKARDAIYGHFKKSLLFSRCIDAESRLRMWWLVGLEIVLMYNWILIPFHLCFPVSTLANTATTDTIADFLLLVDMYLNLNLSYTDNSEKIMDTSRSARHYLRGSFLFDLLCLFPYCWFVSSSSYSTCRIPRLLRVCKFRGHYDEVNRVFHLTNRRKLVLLGLALIMLYHTIACLHFGVTAIEGFSTKDEAWIPSDDIYLEIVNSTHFMGVNGVLFAVYDSELYTIAAKQYFRSLYYATNVLAAVGKTIEPDSDLQYGVALLFMLSGFFITATVVDNVQKRFTASAFEHKQFYATRTRIQLFLRRQNAPLVIFQRVNSFLDFWWSSHRGAFITELLADLPITMKQDILKNICNPALQTLALISGVRPSLDKLEEVFLANVQFILYGQGEVVYRQGDYATGIYFLLEGDVCVIANAVDPRGVPLGSFFGTAALGSDETDDGYHEYVSATTGCILLFVSRDHLQAMQGIYPPIMNDLLSLEKKLLMNKLTQTAVAGIRRNAEARIPASVHDTGRGHSIPRCRIGTDMTSFDPDSPWILLWETWLFIAMSIQWMTVVFQICFRMKKTRYFEADVTTIFLEVSFVVDVYVRSRVGYYTFGNKIMDLATIRNSYFKSSAFVIDVLALVPLYTVNWYRSPDERFDALNINKLFRLMKVPKQFQALENRYLKRTTELRLFKLFYYTFLLSHVLGCMWFDFAANASRIFTTGSSATEFGKDKWLPEASLEFTALNRQYFMSLFWSFGLMSASSTGDLPKTTHECIFSVITMTSGLFLFAYVIGNFTDIIELIGGDVREFSEKLASVRLLLSHFTLPALIEERLKTYYFFKRYHTITQEHHLERCLPPSLLTDIRLVHLKPMIAQVSFLSGMESSVTRMLVSQFSQVLVLRDEYVCRCGEKGSDMYFVFTGMLDVLVPKKKASSKAQEGGKAFMSFAQRKMFDTDDPYYGLITKVNVLSAGSYFGENGLFTNSLRNAYVRATTSCILYKLSRASLELVFDRYPQWKKKVVRIASLQAEQQRLARLSTEEQTRQIGEEKGSMLSQIDVMNQRAEQIEAELNGMRKSVASITGVVEPSRELRPWHRWVINPSKNVFQHIVHGTEAQSSFHLCWLQLAMICTVFTAFVVPYRISFDPMNRTTGVAPLIHLGQLFSEIFFILDVWVSWHVKGSPDSMELYEQNHLVMYRKRRLLWDVIAAIPIDRLLEDFSDNHIFSALHCAKVLNVVVYLGELNRRSVSFEINRFRGVCLMYALAIYWTGCAYMALSMKVGFGDDWHAWAPSRELEIANPEDPSLSQLTLRLLRGVFFGTTAFVKKGKTFTPELSSQLVFTLSVCFMGLLVMACMIGEIAALFISYIWNEVDFRKNHIAVQLYLERMKVSDELKRRTQAFMSFLGASHAGVNYGVIFDEMPESIKSACIMHISQKPLRLFSTAVFRLLAGEAHKDLDDLTHSLARHLRFEGYPRDELVVTRGSISRAMYCVVKGHLGMETESAEGTARVLIRKGDYFGERGLLGCAVSMFSVRTLRACDLLSLSSESLLTIVKSYAFTQVALTLIERAHTRVCHLVPISTDCSRTEMEHIWGEALLLELRALDKNLPAASKMVDDDDGADDQAGTSVAHHHIHSLVGVVEVPSEAIRVFLPLILVVMSRDPLDCSAMRSQRKEGEFS